jgi:hypothetical protein
LCAYAGHFELGSEIRGALRCSGNELLFEREGRPARHCRAELRDVFFEPGEPRTRRIFERNAQDQITGFIDRREGRDVRWQQSAAP